MERTEGMVDRHRQQEVVSGSAGRLDCGACAQRQAQEKIVRPNATPWKMSRQGILKHLLNAQMNTRMDSVDA